MARARRSRSVFDTTGLNLTPLLDVLFNLIFFFLLATTIRDDRERFLDIDLPGSGTAEAREELPDVPIIALDREGTLYFDGSRVTEAELEEKLRLAAATRNATSAIVEIDAENAFQRFIDLTDVCRRAGVLEVTPRLQENRPR